MNPIDPAEALQPWRYLACWCRSRELAGVLAHEIAPSSEFKQALKDGRLAVVVPEEIVRWMQAQD